MLPKRTLCKVSYPSVAARGVYVGCCLETLLRSPRYSFRSRGLCGVRFQRGITTSSDNLVGFGQRHVTAGIARLTEGIMSKGEGSYLSFEDGRRMLDFSCGIGVTNLGKYVVLLCSQSLGSRRDHIKATVTPRSAKPLPNSVQA